MVADRSVPCAQCSAPCCYVYQVLITGYEAWRISHGQKIPWQEFLTIVMEREPTANGFRIDASPTTYELMVAKVPGPAPRLNSGSEMAMEKRPLDQKCVFLINLPNGMGRCGIYEHRPLVCSSYPVQLQVGTPIVIGRLPCPPNGWNLANLNLPVWQERALRFRVETSLYRYVVACWNKRIDTFGCQQEDPNLQVALYYDYVHTIYDRIEELRGLVCADDWKEIEDYWLNDGYAELTENPVLKEALAALSPEPIYAAEKPSTPWAAFVYGVAEIVLTS